jgi:hypothetical protein
MRFVNRRTSLLKKWCDFYVIVLSLYMYSVCYVIIMTVKLRVAFLKVVF